MRSALLRVLTDLYVQKLTHTPDEERHYTELALRLIETVDATTRAAVAAQLGKHLSPPRQVIERLAEDLLEVAGALRLEARDRNDRLAATTRTTTGAAPTNVAAELNEIFFAANAHERRLILLNLDVVIPPAAEQYRVVRDPSVGLRLEAAALARGRDDFVQELARSLAISRGQARRIVDDELGEPIVIAAKALNIRRDLLYRILLFLNPAVGQSVERVYALAQLYDEITLHVAQDLVATWQALGNDGPNAGTHQPLLVRDKLSAQFSPVTQRTPFPRRNERRQAS